MPTTFSQHTRLFAVSVYVADPLENRYNATPMTLREFLLLLAAFGGLSSGLSVSAAAAAERKTASAAEIAAAKKTWDSWNTPVPPFRIIGNVHYVGASGVSSFLITTPQGHILLDTGFESTVPRIQESVTKLGFRLADIKLLLSSHAHLDHTGGHARMKELTGASIVMSEADAALLASGGANDFPPNESGMMNYRPAKAERLVRDGQKVTLGDTTLVCHLSPGHTKGCTSWSMEVTDNGAVHHVVFFGSTTILTGVPLVNNAKYPEIANDLKKTYQTLKALPCDVFLAPHAGFFGMAEKVERMQSGKANPFVEPGEFRAYLVKAEKNFLEQLAAEQGK